MSNLTTSEVGINLIKSFETFMPNPYLDGNGLPTIGYGTRYYQDGTLVTLNDPSIDEPTACQLLSYALQTFERAINAFVTVDLNQNQFDALSSFVYNIGPGNFQHSTVLATLNTGDFTNIPTDMMMWDKVNHQTSNGLVRRRQAEIDLFNS